MINGKLHKYAPLIAVGSNIDGFPGADVCLVGNALQIQSQSQWLFAARRTKPLYCSAGTTIRFQNLPANAASEENLIDASYTSTGGSFSNVGDAGVLFSLNVANGSAA